MTKFEGCFLTNAGLEMVQDTGLARLTFTKAVTGSGSYTSKKEIAELTALKEQQQEFGLDGFEKGTDYNVNIKFKIKNTGLRQGYDLSEIGIYAKGDDGEEKLYCVAYATEGHTEEIPEDDGTIAYVLSLDIETAVSTEAEVAVVFSPEHKWITEYVAGIVGEINVKTDGTIVNQLTTIKDMLGGLTLKVVSEMPDDPTPGTLYFTTGEVID